MARQPQQKTMPSMVGRVQRMREAGNPPEEEIDPWDAAEAIPLAQVPQIKDQLQQIISGGYSEVQTAQWASTMGPRIIASLNLLHDLLKWEDAVKRNYQERHTLLSEE